MDRLRHRKTAYEQAQDAVAQCHILLKNSEMALMEAREIPKEKRGAKTSVMGAERGVKLARANLNKAQSTLKDLRASEAAKKRKAQDSEGVNAVIEKRFKASSKETAKLDKQLEELDRVEEARKAAENARNVKEAHQAEEARKMADEARKAEEARKTADEAHQAEDAHKVADETRKAEDVRKAADKARKAEEARKVEDARKATEDARQAADEAHQAEEALKAADETRKAEDARKAADEAQKAEDAHKATEDARQAADEAHQAEEARKAADESRKVEDARKAAEEARKAENARKATEDARQAADEAHQAEEARKAADESRKAEDARKAADEARKAEDARKVEDARKAVDDARKVADEAHQAEEARQAVEAQKTEEEARKAEEARMVTEEARKADEDARKAKEAHAAADDAQKSGEDNMEEGNAKVTKARKASVTVKNTKARKPKKTDDNGGEGEELAGRLLKARNEFTHMSEDEQETMTKQGIQEIQAYLEKGTLLSPRVRKLIRNCPEYLPQAVMTTRALAIHALETTQKNINCLYHYENRSHKESDMDKARAEAKGERGDYTLTGVRGERSKDNPTDRILHCGCDTDESLMYLLIWKTWKLSAMGGAVVEPILKTHLMPRPRSALVQGYFRGTGLCMNDMYSNKNISEEEHNARLTLLGVRSKLHTLREDWKRMGKNDLTREEMVAMLLESD